MKKLTIAIDGPAGAGKSTVAKIVASCLGYTYIDTGAMYRAVAWQVLQCGYRTDAAAEVARIAKNIKLKLTFAAGKIKVLVNDRDVSAEIRSPAVTKLVAETSQNPEVRREMVELQRQMAASGGAVLDGRDIATFVLPDADVKIFLTASIETRAKRRFKELQAKDIAVEFEQLKAEIAERDRKDYERAMAPLRKAADAILIDTTNMSIEETAANILAICRERG